MGPKVTHSATFQRTKIGDLWQEKHGTHGNGVENDADEDSIWVIIMGDKWIGEEVVHLLRQLGSQSFMAAVKVLCALLVGQCGHRLMSMGSDLTAHASDTNEDGKYGGSGITLGSRACCTRDVREKIHSRRLVVGEVQLRRRHTHQNLVAEGQRRVASHAEEPVKTVSQPESSAPFLHLGPSRLVLRLALVRSIRALVARELDQAESSPGADPAAPKVLKHELIYGQQKPSLYVFNAACKAGVCGGQLLDCLATRMV